MKAKAAGCPGQGEAILGGTSIDRTRAAEGLTKSKPKVMVYFARSPAKFTKTTKCKLRKVDYGKVKILDTFLLHP